GDRRTAHNVTAPPRPALLPALPQISPCRRRRASRGPAVPPGRAPSPRARVRARRGRAHPATGAPELDHDGCRRRRRRARVTRATTPSTLDGRLVGLERGTGEHEVSFEIVPHLCRGDGALYGGTALAASLAAMALVTGRPSIWATAQLVSSARLGEVVRCDVELVARGTYIDQVRISAHVDDRL